MINPRLFEHYQIDTGKDLQISQNCPRPFDTVLIDKRGSCFACECQSWLPQSIGNLQLTGLGQILESKMRVHLQKSISDGSYRYCNEHQCAYLRLPKMIDGKPQHIKHLRLAIDDSCNLRCPSCRKGLVFHKEGSAFRLGIKLADRVNEWLHSYQHPLQVHMGSDGDPFASHVYQHFMQNTPHRDNIKYSILTNGLMFREFHHKIPYVLGNLQELGVSIDGASAGTYEKLRLGGKWSKITEALKCIGELKQVHRFRFVLHMVVQQDNWHETEAMLQLGHSVGADKVYFNKIEDWNTGINFQTQVFLQIPEFQESMQRVRKDPLAWDNVTTSS